MKEILTKDAVGCALMHDITQIIPGQFKGPVFKKGHVIKEEDIPILLSVGKEHVFVYEMNENMVHENDAAHILARICGKENMTHSEPSEGKIEIRSNIDGLFLIDNKRLNVVNSFGEMMIATRSSGFLVKKGDLLAGTRIIPLVIEKEKMDKLKKVVGDEPLFKVVPLKKVRYGLITTGNEVASGRIKDSFTPILNQKMALLGAEMVEHDLLADNPVNITLAIRRMLNNGVDMVLCTGGMSVDPDDKTPLAIKNAGVDIISYGAPTLPGAMFLVSYTKDNRPILGLPGCIMYARRTIFDLLIPYFLTGIKVSKEMISSLGNGGLCLNCEHCTFPNCSFGKGGING